MSRARGLLYRLDHMGHPQVNEQDPQEQEMSDDDDDVAMQQAQDGSDEGEETVESPENTSPFSKDVRNPDGSMKVDQSDQSIDDTRSRFMIRRKR